MVQVSGHKRWRLFGPPADLPLEADRVPRADAAPPTDVVDELILGPGDVIDWRGGEQNLLVASSRSAFGGRSFVYATTVAGGQPREVYVPTADTVIGDAQWHPALDRFFVYEAPLCCGANRPATIWMRKADGTGTKLRESVFMGAPWWSKDGTRLWSQSGGDDSVSYLSDVLSTTAVMFCLRSPTPPCA